MDSYASIHTKGKGATLQEYTDKRYYLKMNPYAEIKDRIRVPSYHVEFIENGAIMVGVDIDGMFDAEWREQCEFTEINISNNGGWFIPDHAYDDFSEYMKKIDSFQNFPTLFQLASEVVNSMNIKDGQLSKLISVPLRKRCRLYRKILI